MKPLLYFLLVWGLVAVFILGVTASCRAQSVSFLYDPGTGLAIVSNQPRIAPAVNAYGFWSNGDGSATFIEMPYLPVFQTASGQYEGRFDIAELIFRGKVYQNVNRFFAYSILTSNTP